MAEYEISEQGYVFTTIEADDVDEALELVDAPDPGDYGSPSSTIWVEWHAVAVADRDDSSSRIFQLDPVEPDCEAGKDHDWRDHDPARGSGGGVKYSERCEHCGAVRWIDTWATNPANGTQGHRSIEYQE